MCTLVLFFVFDLPSVVSSYQNKDILAAYSEAPKKWHCFIRVLLFKTQSITAAKQNYQGKIKTAKISIQRLWLHSKRIINTEPLSTNQVFEFGRATRSLLTMCLYQHQDD